jgi:hypothetical protein
MGDQYERIESLVDIKTAMKAVHRVVRGPARFLSERVMVTDGGDYCNLEWSAEDGLTFPKDETMQELFPPTKKKP